MGRMLNTCMRVRVVHRSIKVCTCCTQRTSHYQTMETENKAFYHLCRMCWDLRYVTNNKLRTTFKLHINAKIRNQLQSVPQILFRDVTGDRPSLMLALDKQVVARKLGYESWTHFIMQNHQKPQSYSKYKSRGIYRYHWKRSAFVE